MRVIRKRRRAEGKTDYKARLVMLNGEKDRVVFRKTNRYIIGQFISSKEAQDSVLMGVNSMELVKYGWPESAGSIKNIPACYLTGFLLGKKVTEKYGKKKAVLDIGLLRNMKGGKMYAFLKGVKDSGMEVPAGEGIFPDEKRVEGRHLKTGIDLKKIKEKIEKD